MPRLLSWVVAHRVVAAHPGCRIAERGECYRSFGMHHGWAAILFANIVCKIIASSRVGHSQKCCSATTRRSDVNLLPTPVAPPHSSWNAGIRIAPQLLRRGQHRDAAAL